MHTHTDSRTRHCPHLHCRVSNVQLQRKPLKLRVAVAHAHKPQSQTHLGGVGCQGGRVPQYRWQRTAYRWRWSVLQTTSQAKARGDEARREAALKRRAAERRHWQFNACFVWHLLPAANTLTTPHSSPTLPAPLLSLLLFSLLLLLRPPLLPLWVCSAAGKWPPLSAPRLMATRGWLAWRV